MGWIVGNSCIWSLPVSDVRWPGRNPASNQSNELRTSLLPRTRRPAKIEAMPELPEVEITVRRLDVGAGRGEVESALAPGMNVMKTFDPPLEALAGAS